MTIFDTAYRYVPELKGKLIQPEDTRMRLSMADFDTIDKKARELGRPAPWRLTHEERNANRKATLAGRMDQDLWVFGYGSLIWDPSINTTELRRARTSGYCRRFCLSQTFDRGSPEHPGLMLGLDLGTEGAFCDAIAMLIPAAHVDSESDYLWRREMIAGSYVPTFLAADTPQGEIQALAFCVDRSNPRYVDMSVPDAARVIASASGAAGTNTAYLENLVSDLDAIGLCDTDMQHLLDEVHDADA